MSTNTKNLKDFKEQAHQMGNRVTTRRKAMKKTRAELSVDTGLSFSTLSDIENGNRTASAYSLYQIAKALRCPLSELQPEDLDNYNKYSSGIFALNEELSKLPYDQQRLKLAIFMRILDA